MTDVVDRANDRAEEILAEALYQHGRRAGIGGRVFDDSGTADLNAEGTAW